MSPHITHKPRYIYRQSWFWKNIGSMPKSIKILSAVIFLYTIGWAMATPFIPLYLKDVLKFNYTTIGIVLSLQAFFAVIWDIPVGMLIDRISKRRTLSFALFLYIPFSFIFFSMKTILHFVFFRAYHAFIVTPLWLSADSYTRAHSPKGKSSQAFSMYDTSINLSFMIGPVLGGLLFYLIGFSIIYAISIGSGIALIISFLLPDHKKGRVFSGMKSATSKGIAFKAFRDFKDNKPLMKVSLLILIYSFGFSFMGMLLPLFTRQFGASFLQVGLIYGLFHLPWIAEIYFGTDNHKSRLLLLAFFTAMGLFTALFFTSNLYMLFILSSMLSLCFAAILPTLQGKITDVVPKKKIGETTGIIMSMRHLSLGLGPIIAGIISDAYGLRYVFIMGAVVFLILGLTGIMFRKIFDANALPADYTESDGQQVL